MKLVLPILTILLMSKLYADCTPDPVCDPCDGVTPGSPGSCNYTVCNTESYTYPTITTLPVPAPSSVPANACNLIPSITSIRHLPFSVNGSQYKTLPANNVVFSYQSCTEQTNTNPSCPVLGGGGGPACGAVQGGINGTCTSGSPSAGSQAGGLLYWTCTSGGTTIPCSGPACFTKGTQILMADKTTKNIEDIQVGDEVIGSSQSINKVLELKPSMHIGKKYSINGSPFFVTEGHPFMTTDGWKAFNPETAKILNPTLEIGKLIEGDYLIMSNRVEKIEKIDWVETEEKVYNFELDGSKDYYADDFLVHNK